MDPALKSLVDLQRMLSEQNRLRKRLREIPTEIEALRRDRELLERRREEHAEALHELERQERKCEKDLIATEENIEKKKGTLGELKTNKEYTAGKQEIDTLQKKKTELEEKALQLMDQIGAERENLKLEEESIRNEEAAVDERIRQSEEEFNRAKDIIKQIEKDLPNIQKKIIPELMERFKKLYYSKNGLALAEVHDGCCSGCQMALSPQLAQSAGAGDRIVSCDNCGRIVYMVREPGTEDGIQN